MDKNKGQDYDVFMDAEELHAERQAARKSEETTFLADLKTVLATGPGSRVLWRIMDECRVFTSCMTGNSWTFHNEGRRDVGLFIFSSILEADDLAYARMAKANKDSIIENNSKPEK